MQYYYLLALITSIAGLLYADYRYKLMWWYNRKQATICLVAGVTFFLLWDIVGIVLGVFATNQAWVSGWHVITPNLPIEEFLFLGLLSMNCMIGWRLACSRIS